MMIYIQDPFLNVWDVTKTMSDTELQKQLFFKHNRRLPAPKIGALLPLHTSGEKAPQFLNPQSKTPLDY